MTHLWQSQLLLQANLFRPPLRRNLQPARLRSAEMLDALFFDLLKVVNPDLFVEAGAFDADSSLRVARDVSSCTVIAFEANPDNYAHFAALRQYEKHGVTYLNLALTDTPGPITFHIESKEGSTILGHSSTLPRTRASEDPVRPVTVEGVRLDDHTPDAEKVVMWVDVEGAADRVLLGAPQRLASCDLIKIEVEEEAFWEGQALSADIMAHLLQAGLVPVARDIEFPSQYNVLFASPRLLRRRPAIEMIEAFLVDCQETTVPPALARARAHPLYGKASTVVRKALANR